jgi:hypothetical protein
VIFSSIDINLDFLYWSVYVKKVINQYEWIYRNLKSLRREGFNIFLSDFDNVDFSFSYQNSNKLYDCPCHNNLDLTLWVVAPMFSLYP